MELKPDTDSYMQFCLNMDEAPLYLMVPTYHDPIKNEWRGAVHLKKAKKMIMGRGKDSKELETNFNESLGRVLESECGEEAFDLFKPLSYWDEMIS